MVDRLFLEIGLILLVTTLFVHLFRLLKQPTIIPYILTGMILGPLGFNVLQSQEALRTFSVIGVAFLLFIVGLNLNIKLLKDVGKVSAIAGLSQLLFTTLIGLFLIQYIGFSLIEAGIISLALAFSSTIIVVKLLTDKNDLDTLYGKIALGFLIVQDFVAIFAIMFISSFSHKGIVTNELFLTILKGILLFIIAVIMNKLFVTKFMAKAAENQEVLLISSLSWCFLFMMISYALGFSLEIGAFLAGITLAAVPYTYQISSRVKPLRDFFIMAFFVSIGASIVIAPVKQLLTPIILASLFVLIGNPLIVMIILGILGFKKRTGFLTGLAIAQTSEFSLILVNLASSLNLVSKDGVYLTTLVSLITITLSTYFIIFNDKLYNFFSPYLDIFERKKLKENNFTFHAKRKRYDIVLLGQNRLGYGIVNELQKNKKSFVVVDYNPTIVKRLREKNIPCFYGDIADTEILKGILRYKPQLIISTVNTFDENLIVTKSFRKKKNIMIIVTAPTMEKALDLYKEGADYVIIPHILGGEKFAEMVKGSKFSKKQLTKVREEHITQILKSKA